MLRVEVARRHARRVEEADAASELSRPILSSSASCERLIDAWKETGLTEGENATLEYVAGNPGPQPKRHRRAGISPHRTKLVRERAFGPAFATFAPYPVLHVVHGAAHSSCRKTFLIERNLDNRRRIKNEPPCSGHSDASGTGHSWGSSPRGLLYARATGQLRYHQSIAHSKQLLVVAHHPEATRPGVVGKPFLQRRYGSVLSRIRQRGADWAAASMQTPTLQGERILLLEDEALIGLEVRHVLEHEGASVSIAHNLRQALQYADDSRFSAGVLDVQLGYGNAEPVCLALHRRKVPFIFFTGMSDQLSGQWAETPIVQKPARPEAIVGALKFVLLPQTRRIFAEARRGEDHRIDARIDRMIRDGEERILLFRRGIALLASAGQDTSAAEALVATIAESVENLRTHRRMSASLVWRRPVR